MGVKKIDFKRLTDEFISVVNKEFKNQEIDLALGVNIITKGTTKEIKFYSSDTTTGDRVLLFERTFEVKNSAEFLRQDINSILYRELFYNAFVFYGVNRDSMVREEQAAKAIDTLKPDVKSKPVTPDDAFTKAIKEDMERSKREDAEKYSKLDE